MASAICAWVAGTGMIGCGGGGCGGGNGWALLPMMVAYLAGETAMARCPCRPPPSWECTDMALLFTSLCSRRREAHVGGWLSVAIGVRTGNGKFAVTAVGNDMVDCRLSDSIIELCCPEVTPTIKQRRKDETKRNKRVLLL